MSVKEITGKDAFAQELADADKLIIVDFWAEWCGPCRMLGPVLHDLAEKYPDQVQLLKINVDSPDNQPLAMEYGVRSIPQVTFFKGGEQVDQFIGALPPEQVENYITKHVGQQE